MADVIYWCAFSGLGYAGVAAVVAASLVALQIVVFAHVRRSVGPLGIAAAIAAMDAVLGAFLTARPHVLVWPILAAWTAILLRSLETGKTPPWWSVLLLVLWTNIHASFPLALAIAGAIALDALIACKWRTLPQWAAFLALSLAALLVNANGLAGVLQPFHISSLDMLSRINEWQASTPSLTPQFYAVLLLGLGALLWRGVKIPAGQLALLLVLLFLAFRHVRHQEWFIIVAALVLPAHFHSTGWARSNIKPFILLAVAAIAIRAAVPLLPPDSSDSPRHLIAAVPPQLRGQPVFNGYSFGGPLILAGIRPYIDGRAEMYGDPFFAEFDRITDGDMAAFERTAAHYRIKWTMLPYANAPLVRQLDRSPQWRRLYADRIGVIHVRRDLGGELSRSVQPASATDGRSTP